MANRSSFIRVDEFQSMRQIIKGRLSGQIGELFMEKAKHSLLSAPLNVNPKFAERAARDIIVSGQRIFENAEQCDVNPEQARLKQIEKDKLYGMSDRYRNLIDEAALILETKTSAPEQCDGIFSDQLDCFGKLYPSVRNNPAQFPIIHAKLQNFDSIKADIIAFFSKAALCTKTVVIVFNGIVKQNHMFISEHSSLPLPVFFESVRDIFMECFGTHMMPFVVDIAFQELSDSQNAGLYVNVVSFSYQSGLSFVTQNYTVLLENMHNHQSSTSSFSPPFVQAAGSYDIAPSLRFKSTSLPQKPTTAKPHIFQTSWSVEQPGIDETD